MTTARVSDRSRSRGRKPKHNSTCKCPQKGIEGVDTGGQGDPGRAARLGGQHELWTRNKEGTGKAQGQGREAPWAKGGTRLRHEALNVA